MRARNKQASKRRPPRFARLLRPAVAVGVLLASAPVAAPGAQEDPPAASATAAAAAGSPLAGWTRLRLEGSKFLLASAESTVGRWPAPSPRLVWVRTVIQSIVGGRKHSAFSSREPNEPLPAHWMEIDPGKRARDVRVSDSGTLVYRRFGPPPGQSSPWAGPWTEGKAETRELRLRAGTGVCAGPFDPWALLAHLECLTVAPEVPFQLFANDAVHEVIARRRGRHEVRLALDDLEAGAHPGPRVTLEVDDVELLPGPGEPDPSVFGLQGNITLQIDRGSGALVQIEGRREGIPGTIKFRLTGFAKSERRPEVPWPERARNAMTVPAS